METIIQDVKYTIENAKEKCPKHLLKTVYDNVLFGSRYTKGKVGYHYVPAELMEKGNPFIINISVAYDGKGNSDLPEGSLVMHFNELPKMFPDNKFNG